VIRVEEDHRDGLDEAQKEETKKENDWLCPL
jgi:hypothetical protein